MERHFVRAGLGHGNRRWFRNLSYDYQLNGVEGLYEARVYPADWSGDWGAEPLASVTFTDQDHRQVTRANEATKLRHGNVSEYTEGEPINFRFTLTGDPAMRPAADSL